MASRMSRSCTSGAEEASRKRISMIELLPIPVLLNQSRKKIINHETHKVRVGVCTDWLVGGGIIVSGPNADHGVFCPISQGFVLWDHYASLGPELKHNQSQDVV